MVFGELPGSKYINNFYDSMHNSAVDSTIGNRISESEVSTESERSIQRKNEISALRKHIEELESTLKNALPQSKILTISAQDYASIESRSLNDYKAVGIEGMLTSTYLNYLDLTLFPIKRVDHPYEFEARMMYLRKLCRGIAVTRPANTEVIVGYQRGTRDESRLWERGTALIPVSRFKQFLNTAIKKSS